MTQESENYFLCGPLQKTFLTSWLKTTRLYLILVLPCGGVDSSGLILVIQRYKEKGSFIHWVQQMAERLSLERL